MPPINELAASEPATSEPSAPESVASESASDVTSGATSTPTLVQEVVSEDAKHSPTIVGDTSPVDDETQVLPAHALAAATETPETPAATETPGTETPETPGTVAATPVASGTPEAAMPPDMTGPLPPPADSTPTAPTARSESAAPAASSAPIPLSTTSEPSPDTSVIAPITPHDDSSVIAAPEPPQDGATTTPLTTDTAGTPKTTKPSVSTRALVIVLVVAIIIALAGLAAYLIPRLRAEPGAADSPTAAVQAYLSALASGDADTALLYSATQPTDTTYLTNGFLSQMMAVHPIANVVIPDGQPSESPATIHASYNLGDVPVDAQFTVQHHGRKWLLDGGFLTLNLTGLIDWGVPLTLNGVDLGQSGTVQLFPGVYTLALTDDPMLTVTNPTFTIEYPEASPTFDEMSLTLSEDGAARIDAAAQAKLTDCLASHELQPAGCGFGFVGAANGTVDPATVTWTLEESSDLATTALTLDGSSTTVALGDISLSASIHAVSTDGTQNYTGTSSASKLRADFTDPDNIQVSFGNS